MAANSEMPGNFYLDKNIYSCYTEVAEEVEEQIIDEEDED